MAYTVIDKGSKYFDTKLYTGTGATQSITGLNFSPDWVWIKSRSSASYYNTLFDIIRGTEKRIFTNTTDAESTTANSLTSFNSDGFTLGSQAGQNDSGITYVAWNWEANGAGVSNTQGTLTATVSANTTSGFSICKITEASSYSGTQTFGHGLGVAPSMVIYRQQNNSSNWQVYHKATGTGITQLNNTNAVNTGASYFPAVSSTTVSIGEGIQAPTYTSIAYCFADVKGFSKAFSYTGNGSNDGTFCYLGFKPAFIIWKDSTSVMSWGIFDNKRDPYNEVENFLRPNTSDADSAGDYQIDFLSNGFKIRNANGLSNNSGDVYIGMAFAENPFVSSKGIPCTAR